VLVSGTAEPDECSPAEPVVYVNELLHDKGRLVIRQNPNSFLCFPTKPTTADETMAGFSLVSHYFGMIRPRCERNGYETYGCISVGCCGTFDTAGCS
jgi:hypothetical protein